MKKIPKEKRVINIDKEDFEKIQDYCNKNSLKMSKWMSQIAIEKSIQSDIKTKVFESIGEASMCWNPRPKGVFDSTHASEIADRLWDLIRNNNSIKETK